MNHLSRKKIVFVIVEGPSDETALGVSLSRMFNSDEVYIHIMHGDITTRKGITGSNVVASVGNEVRKYAASRHYKKTDFSQIIHIVDIDGAFIPNESIIQDDGSSEVLYSTDNIHTPDRDMLIERNRQKQENIFRLRGQPNIWDIPYRIYYMSCNLDHVLYDKLNSTDGEKENDAYEFARKYKNDLEGFVEYMCDSDFSVQGNYKETWEHIEKDTNSLKRFTNFNLCIKDALITRRSE